MTKHKSSPVTSAAQMTKTADDENFPVASLFLQPSVRTEVMQFYKFARTADDIADDPHLKSYEKRYQLNELSKQTDNPYLQDLIKAFLQDCTKERYQTWDELLDYCRYSANPVGRFLLEVHGDLNEETAKASDALCTVLQILNHLQDCQKDYVQMNRIYLPGDYLTTMHTYETLLELNSTRQPLQKVFDKCHEQCEQLLEEARALSSLIKSKRLRFQARVTFHCATKLLAKLRTQDPLARRVELTKIDKLLLVIKGVFH